MKIQTDIDLSTQEILLAASQHDLARLRALLRNTTANVQDPETGYTALHAAIAACGPEDHVSHEPNGVEYAPDDAETETVAAAAHTLKLLFQNGAIWNDLDAKDETPGCLALRLNLMRLYEIMVDAGVRAELLLNRLDSYEALTDGGVEADDEEEDTDDYEVIDMTIGKGGTEEENAIEPVHNANDDSTNSANYLASSLRFQDDRLLDDSRNGVMMAWESDIMKRSADLLVPSPELTVLNVGHGMGIIDDFMQAKSPAAHHIVEAHPQVLQQMRQNGWYNKPNVTIHEGKWQDVLPKLVEQGVVFDAIYFDTFAEDYKAFSHFFNEFVIGLLSANGLWGFFHGMGADRQISYDVYTKVVEMDLFEAGFDIEWDTMDVPDLRQSEEWQGVRRKYWALDKYTLPVCKFVG